MMRFVFSHENPRYSLTNTTASIRFRGVMAENKPGRQSPNCHHLERCASRFASSLSGLTFFRTMSNKSGQLVASSSDIPAKNITHLWLLCVGLLLSSSPPRNGNILSWFLRFLEITSFIEFVLDARDSSSSNVKPTPA